MGTCSDGGLLEQNGGWKTGVCVLLSTACVACMLITTSPAVVSGYVGADDGAVSLTCGLWKCLWLTREEDGGHDSRGTWHSQSITSAFPQCGELERHMHAFQVTACVLAATAVWSWVNHALNLLGGCLRCCRRMLFVFHLADAVLALVTFSLMAGAYHQSFCGDGVALKDYRVMDEGMELGIEVFGAVVLVFAMSTAASLLCLFGAYQSGTLAVAPAVYDFDRPSPRAKRGNSPAAAAPAQ
eukprot:TRINITY_DN35698_c0_g1_i1.p1 TRINITY_DN35698_c0_g1~~TRINITY_DN35698_c0_g1_i1.p1  ORF type:complete len:241 (+),score=88.88 TRINITY_DN35698_c0_g1_i1:39-761(+)